MKTEVFILIIFIGSIYIISTICYCISSMYDFSFLNPIRNYKKFSSFNWFGIIIYTLILNILWLPYAIIYWLYKLIYFICTVGRKNNMNRNELRNEIDMLNGNINRMMISRDKEEIANMYKYAAQKLSIIYIENINRLNNK